jgi:hypothetical protein
MPHDIVMRAIHHSEIAEAAPFAPRRQRVRTDQEAIDDQKFQEKIERRRFIERIEREANEGIVCPGCGNSNWRMHHKYWVNWLTNDLIATMICRKCKRKMPFGTHIEKDDEEQEDDEEESEGFPFNPFGFGRRRRRKHRLDFDTRLRLMAHYH